MFENEALCRKHFGTDDYVEAQAIFDQGLRELKMPSADGWVKMPLPYYAPDDSLPPIPTPEDVENARALDYDESRNNVYRVNEVYIVKFSAYPEVFYEAENLLFLQDHEVRSPKLYAAFTHQGTDPLGWTTRKRNPMPRSELPPFHYVVMEYISGVNPHDEMFEGFKPHVRAKLYYKIAEQLRLLRSIPPPNPHYYGRIHHQPMTPLFPVTRYKTDTVVGPWDTYEAFLEQVYNTLEVNQINKLGKGRPNFSPNAKLHASIFFDNFDPASKAAEPKLSHMDLKVENMMLVPSASNSSERIEDYDVWIIDWEWMAWLPAWVEVAGAMKRLPKPDTVFGDGEQNEAIWPLSHGISPFYKAEADFYLSCIGALGGWL